MISSDTLAKYRLDSKALKKFFTGATAIKPGSAARKLSEQLAAWVNDGIQGSFRDATTWRTVHELSNMSVNTLSPALLYAILQKSRTPKDLQENLKQAGISLEGCFRKNADGQDECIIPLFFNFCINLIKPFRTIKAAKLLEGFINTPFFKYDPAHATLKNQLRCDVVTSVMQRCSDDTGAKTTMRQAVLQSLDYASQFMFPAEHWYSEHGFDGEKKVNFRAGVRNNLPPPWRTFFDQTYRPSTFNTDSGCRFAGYWSLRRYSELKNDPAFFNTDKVLFGDWSWMQMYTSQLSFMTGCQEIVTPVNTLPSNDREENSQYWQYSSNQQDEAHVFVTEIFAKLNPKDWGISTYNQPIWFRFIIGGDNTVIYARAFQYSRPVLYLGHEADESKRINSSLTVELAPYQVVLSNLLTHYLKKAQQSLSRVVAVNKFQFKKEDLETLTQTQASSLGNTVFIEFDPLADSAATGVPVERSLHDITPPIGDHSVVLQGIPMLLNILQSVVGFSPQELGQAGPHQQSAKETSVIAGYVGLRDAFSKTYLDDFMAAWARRDYEAACAHLPDSIEASIIRNIPDAEKVLEELGFEVDEEESAGNRVKVKGLKSNISYLEFTTNRVGQERPVDAAVASSIVQFLQVIMPALAQKNLLGDETLIRIANRLSKYFQLPEGFEIPITQANQQGGLLGAGTKEETLAILQKLQEAFNAAELKQSEMLMAATAEADQKLLAGIQTLQQDLVGLQTVVRGLIEAQQAPPPPEPVPVPVPVVPPAFAPAPEPQPVF